MTATVQNPNDLSYWTEVKHRTARREALNMLEKPRRSNALPYEVWLSDVLRDIETAGYVCGLDRDDHENQERLLRAECAIVFAMPCLATMTNAEIKVIHEVAHDFRMSFDA